MKQRVSDEEVADELAGMAEVDRADGTKAYGEDWLLDLRDARDEIARLRDALEKAEPWSHVVPAPPGYGTTVAPFKGSLASMAPGLAEEGSPVQHWKECPGCAARDALRPQAEARLPEKGGAGGSENDDPIEVGRRPTSCKNASSPSRPKTS